MTRLEQHQQKQFFFRLVFFSILIIAMIYFVFAYGFKIILNSSAWIAGLTTKKTTNEVVKNEDFFGNADIDNIPTATNSATIPVNFTVKNFDTVEIYLNGEKFKEIKTNNQDSFYEEVKDLQKGNNEIFILAKNQQYKKEKKSIIYSVLYKSDKPKLGISEPADKTKTNKPDIKISGETDKETFIKINDLPVVVDAKNKFQYNFNLKQGENKITITAQDEAGNIETKELTLIYEKDD